MQTEMPSSCDNSSANEQFPASFDTHGVLNDTQMGRLLQRSSCDRERLDGELRLYHAVATLGAVRRPWRSPNVAGRAVLLRLLPRHIPSPLALLVLAVAIDCTLRIVVQRCDDRVCKHQISTRASGRAASASLVRGITHPIFIENRACQACHGIMH